MTILFFCNLSTGKLGAFEHFLLLMGRRLSADGSRLVVLFGAPPFGSVPDALKEAGITWDYIEGWAGKDGHARAWRFVRPALTALRRYRPDIVGVHFGNEFPVILAVLLSKLFVKVSPVWVWYQHQQIEPPSLVTSNLSRIRCLGWVVDHCVVLYEGGRRSLLLRKLKPGSISRIYNGVMDCSLSRPQGWLKQELRLPPDAVLAVSVGWLIPRKCIDFTIRAFEESAKNNPKAILLIVGDGPERARLELCARSLGLESRVLFLGARGDTREILLQCDCLVHSASSEACVYAVLESMASGIPAVVVDAGAAREQVSDGRSGYVVKQNDEPSFSEKLEEVLRNSETRKLMGFAARQRWSELFSLEGSVIKHCELCRNLAGKIPLGLPSFSVKVLFFCNLIPLKTGAFEKLLSAIGQKFREVGSEFIVYFSGQPIKPVIESLHESGVRWEIHSEWADGPGKVRQWGFILPALRRVVQERPDVVVVHFGNELPTLITILLARLMGFRKIKWVWQQDQQIRDPNVFGKCLSRLRLLGTVADHFVAMYEGGRESMLKRGIPVDKITVIHNAVTPYSPARPKGWLRQELGIPANEIILVTIGSLIPRKRIDFLLRACALLNSLTPEPLNPLTPRRQLWRLLVIGEGSEREPLAALTRKLGIADQVHFLGLRNDIREILPECDLYVHASSAETCTYSVTESMAAGIPAVMLNAGAAKEQIANGVSGYVLDAVDAEAFASRVRELMVDEAKRTEMGRVAEVRWRENFTMDVSASAYHRLYTRLGRGKG